MKMTILLTPKNNVSNGRLIEQALTSSTTLDWECNIHVLPRDGSSEKLTQIKVRHLSFYDHNLMVGEIECIPLAGHSRS